MTNLNVNKVTKLKSLRNRLKIHNTNEPMLKDFHSKCGFETAFIMWHRVSTEILSEIFRIEDSM